MYHARFNGTHCAIGKKWGMLLSKNGKQLLDNIPFDITKEMKEFAQQCYPVYEEYYPEIIDKSKALRMVKRLNQILSMLFSFRCMHLSKSRIAQASSLRMSSPFYSDAIVTF